MGVPYTRVSKQKTRQRQAANRYQGIQASACPVCGVLRLPHRVCLKCGHYGKKQVITTTSSAG
jgi:large subunit ribosomal protein L32